MICHNLSFMNYELGNQCLLGLVNSQIRNLNLLSTDSSNRMYRKIVCFIYIAHSVSLCRGSGKSSSALERRNEV